MIIKKELIDLSYMFTECKSLKNIDELKYLDVRKSDNFVYTFYDRSLLKDIYNPYIIRMFQMV